MNRPLNTVRNFRRNARHLALLVAASATLACHVTAATIVADFSGGNSTEVVDAYRGKGGDGWVDNWKLSTNSTGSQSITAVDGSLFSNEAEGYYLRSTLKRNSGTPSAVVARQYNDYGDIELAKSHVVSFEFRLDSALSELNRLLLFDGQIVSRDHTTTNANPSWMIRYDTPKTNLFVYDGTSQRDTGVTFVVGNVYRLTIHINPEDSQYKMQIENLTTPTSNYESPDWLNFYTASGSVGGVLNFAGQTASVDDAEVVLSLDTIHINAIPEPSSMAFLGLALAGAWLVKRGLRK